MLKSLLRIRTILQAPDGNGLFSSDGAWIDPPYAFTNGRRGEFVPLPDYAAEVLSRHGIEAEKFKPGEYITLHAEAAPLPILKLINALDAAWLEQAG